MTNSISIDRVISLCNEYIDYLESEKNSYIRYSDSDSFEADITSKIEAVKDLKERVKELSPDDEN